MEAIQAIALQSYPLKSLMYQSAKRRECLANVSVRIWRAVIFFMEDGTGNEHENHLLTGQWSHPYMDAHNTGRVVGAWLVLIFEGKKGDEKKKRTGEQERLPISLTVPLVWGTSKHLCSCFQNERLLKSFQHVTHLHHIHRQQRQILLHQPYQTVLHTTSTEPVRASTRT